MNTYNKIYNKVATAGLSALLTAFALTLGSCNDYLDTESPSQQTSQVIFENEGMARSALMGIYCDLTNTYVYGQKMSVNWQGVDDIELASGYNSDPSKEMTSDTGAANYYGDWYNHTVQWSDIFKMGERAATAVEGIRNSEAFKNGSVAMQRYLGEALTLRTIAYFELVRRWGDIPYKEGTSESDLSNVYAGKTSRDEIYPALIRDMEEAIQYLPWMGEEKDYTVERITKGFARYYLNTVKNNIGISLIDEQIRKREELQDMTESIIELKGDLLNKLENIQNNQELQMKKIAYCLQNSGDEQVERLANRVFGDTILKKIDMANYDSVYKARNKERGSIFIPRDSIFNRKQSITSMNEDNNNNNSKRGSFIDNEKRQSINKSKRQSFINKSKRSSFIDNKVQRKSLFKKENDIIPEDVNEIEG